MQINFYTRTVQLCICGITVNIVSLDIWWRCKIKGVLSFACKFKIKKKKKLKEKRKKRTDRQKEKTVTQKEKRHIGKKTDGQKVKKKTDKKKNFFI